MRWLSQRDAAALLEVVSELDGLDDPLPFPPRFVGSLARLINRNESAGYSVLDRRNRRGVLGVGWYEGIEEIQVGHDEGGEQYLRLRHSHPVCSFRERTGDWTSVRTVSDFATQREFRRTEIWNEAYRPRGVNYWLDMGLPAQRGTTRVFVFTRTRTDFGERERLLLELLEPHLERRAREVETTTAAVESLAAITDDGAEPREVVLANARGGIEFASPHARSLLRRYVGVTNGTLSEGLRSVGTITACEERGRLTVRIARVASLLVLLLAESDARKEALTRRQSEVMAGVAAGLTDAQIAERLGVAPATVGKHLEAVYERLAVHTRTAAAAVWRR